MRRRHLALIVAVLVLASSSCELTIGVGSEHATKLDEAPGGANKPLDILFVVDNSGSMTEEQLALSQTIYKDGCPIDDLQNVPEALLNPEPGSPVLEELTQVCGFAQILA